MKNQERKPILAALLLMLGVGASAQPAQGWQNGVQPHVSGNSGNGAVRSFYLPENSGFGSGGNTDRSYGSDQQQPSKMSPEERRTLRRQINEVGHDIYTAPKR